MENLELLNLINAWGRANPNKEFTVRELREELGVMETVSPQKIASSLARCNAYKSRENNKHVNVYCFVAPCRVLNGQYRKEKNLLIFNTDDESVEIVYDFKTNTFINSNDVMCFQPSNQLGIKLFNRIKKFGIKEWLLSYPDLLKEVLDGDLYIDYDLKPHFIETIKAYNIPLKYIDNQNVENVLEIYKKYGLENKVFYSFFKRFSNTRFLLSVIPYIDINDLRKILMVNAKEFVYFTNGEIHNLLSRINKLSKAKIAFKLDTNRNLQYNIEELDRLLKSKENEILGSQLKRLNFLKSTTNDNELLMVVVPQKLEDLQEEGRMQHNCVGHYYNSSIKEGRNLIYFIRKVQSTDKSYITCRFNTVEMRTVEYRAINNFDVTGKLEKAFIKEIDKIIKANLR